ncbi:MAG: hypothetical protein RID07_09275, partial [Lacipirellulaceae bacterium]|uniref:hypothetical protein n=1 Tax=Algiphilus sp. TaxID=1872431 RepID=UPI0032EF3D40
DGELNVTLCSSLRPDTHTGIAHIPFYFTDYMSHAELSSNPHCIPDTLYFEHSEDASEEIFRLNRRLGLSDDEIVERIEFIVDREMPGGEAMS